ncbi:hypothetical protein HU723_17660 [Pseudomonas lurida]|jgi:hypothetical protein|uniref:hypothetical protein n=4 Tax=Pseudomonas TaxID=286 RepID=UPI000CF64248|nr:hypothetical protein [Pseudomonas lurida]AVJ39059.1 hypothetical protein CLM75_17590 [Pseudomonas lurida]MBC3240998.1 hypothetical protein [Pseudomonas lurida]PRB96748.1 hypothetical protein CQ014_22655 [Pseudomonas lurida]WSO03591.1 hypothetical protein VUJ48_17540 [Pseudomonas lurida]
MAQSYINERATDYHSLKSRMMGNALSRSRSDHFDVLNRHLRPGLVAPGQLVIIPDSHSVSCSVEEAWLMRHAEEVRRHLELNAAAGTAMIANYDLLQSFMANASIGVGSATSAWARHLDEVAQTLEETARLHQRLKDGGLDRAAFVQHRQALFRRLEVQLQGAARFGTGLQGNESLKKVLGISTKRYLHKGEIAGYAQRMREMAQTSRWLSRGTYVGLALDVGVAGLEIKEACVTGREAQCRRAKYVETGRFVGGVLGAAGGGALGAELTRRACTIFLGVATRGSGALTCAIVGGAAGGYAGGNLGGAGGELLGGKVIEMDGDVIFQPEGV